MSQIQINSSNNEKALVYWTTLLTSMNKGNDLLNSSGAVAKQEGLPENFFHPHKSYQQMKRQISESSQVTRKKSKTKEKTKKKSIIKDLDTNLPINQEAFERMLLAKQIQELFSPKTTATNNLRYDEFQNWQQVANLWRKKIEKQSFLENESKSNISLDEDDYSISNLKKDDLLISEKSLELKNLINQQPDLKSNSQGMGGTHGSDAPSTGFILSEDELISILDRLETKMIKSMRVEELLKDDELVNTITPSMSLIEELLYQKDRIDSRALQNAKLLIKRFVDKLTEVFKTKVEKSIRRIPDPDIPPKRTFRNLDMKSTIWKNLPNWNNADKKLYVDRIFYVRASKKTIPSKIIIVVDQSGSMVEAMVQTSILASIFTGLPNTNIELLAFDTQVVDLTKYIRDPFEVLLQTKLGGGTYINLALVEAVKRIEDPKNTAVVLITDYYEGGSYDMLKKTILSIKENGSEFISVGPMSKNRNVYVNGHFTNELKQHKIETIMGGPDDLIEQLKRFL